MCNKFRSGCHDSLNECYQKKVADSSEKGILMLTWPPGLDVRHLFRVSNAVNCTTYCTELPMCYVMLLSYFETYHISPILHPLLIQYIPFHIIHCGMTHPAHSPNISTQSTTSAPANSSDAASHSRILHPSSLSLCLPIVKLPCTHEKNPESGKPQLAFAPRVSMPRSSSFGVSAYVWLQWRSLHFNGVKRQTNP